MLKVFNPRNLLRLIDEAPSRTGKSKEAVAHEMGGVNPNTLRRKLNPDDEGAFLHIDELVYLMAVTDLEPLDYLESAFGRVAFNVPKAVGGESDVILVKAGKATQEFGEFLCKCGEITSPDSEGGKEITNDEAKSTLKELDDVLRVLASARAFLTYVIEKT